MKKHEREAMELVKMFVPLARGDVYRQVFDFAERQPHYPQGNGKYKFVCDQSKVYHAIRCAIKLLEEQLRLIEEISVQSMAEIVVRKHKEIKKQIKFLKKAR